MGEGRNAMKKQGQEKIICNLPKKSQCNSSVALFVNS